VGSEKNFRISIFEFRFRRLHERTPDERSNEAVCITNPKDGGCVTNDSKRQRDREPTRPRSTSVAANYRALCRSKSRADFINKTSIVEEEADESAFWLELIVDAGLLGGKRVTPLLDEASEITAMLVASRKTALSRGR
jgi:four helix bundle protein